MTRRPSSTWFVCLLLLTPFWLSPAHAASSAAAKNSARPNMVLIIADDLGWDDCGPYGNTAVRTPNLDRLARQGMRFDRAFLTCSSCSPSRSSIITGRYPHNTDAEQLHWPLPRTQITFVEKLKAAGYWTAAVGKWHLGNQVKDRFNLVREAGSAGFQLPAKGEAAGPMIEQKNESGCADWLPTLQSRPKDKPFFLWLAAFDPHRDYKTNAIPSPHDPAKVVVPDHLPDVPATRADLALYYDEISRLDTYVGRILDELDRQGVATNTLVVFMSDNGRAFPRAKTTVYDSGIKTPLLMRWPARILAGSQCGSLVSSVDLAPTFLELAGLNPLPSFQGRSFAALFTNQTAVIRQHAFAEHNWHDFDAHSRAVRTERYKYIRNFDVNLPNTPPADGVRSPTFQIMRTLRDEGLLTPAQLAPFTKPLPTEELYDTEKDPGETMNLAGDPGHVEVLARLRGELNRWMSETGDPIPGVRAADEFDRELGTPLPNRERPRPSKEKLRSKADRPGL